MSSDVPSGRPAAPAYKKQPVLRTKDYTGAGSRISPAYTVTPDEVSSLLGIPQYRVDRLIRDSLPGEDGEVPLDAPLDIASTSGGYSVALASVFAYRQRLIDCARIDVDAINHRAA